MTDQLFLSIWLQRHAQAQRLRYFQKLLRFFPFSQREQQPQSTVSVLAIDMTEPPLLERAMNGPLDLADVETMLADYKGDDIAYQVESWWDLWQFDEDWHLQPARVTLSCFGPDFHNGTEQETGAQEDLRIDFGVDSHYLPETGAAGDARMMESNIKSLLRLVHELESALPVAHRRLQTESGENFADRLQQALAAAERRQ